MAHFLMQISPGSLLAWLGLAVGATFVVMIAWQVESVRRDFTTNTAETASDAADERLRPIVTDLPIEQVAVVVEQAASGLKHWKFIKRTQAEEVTALHFERRTQFVRFTDDVTVYLQVLPAGGTLLHAHSGSRIGVGDLGQNPRNLRELLGKLRAVLTRAPPPAEEE